MLTEHSTKQMANGADKITQMIENMISTNCRFHDIVGVSAEDAVWWVATPFE